MIISTLGIQDNLLPIRVICLGSDKDPATTEDITEVQNYLKDHDDLPKDWPKITRSYKVHRSPLPGTLIVKVGSRNRPSRTKDMNDVMKQLTDTVDDPDLTIVTHHNFEMEWVEKGVAISILSVEDGSEEECVPGVRNDNTKIQIN